MKKNSENWSINLISEKLQKKIKKNKKENAKCRVSHHTDSLALFSWI